MFIFSVDPDDPRYCAKIVGNFAGNCCREVGHEGECWIVQPERSIDADSTDQAV